MPVEDHPRYEEWREANDSLKRAAEARDDAIRTKQPQAVIDAAQGNVDWAQTKYDRISEEIGSD